MPEDMFPGIDTMELSEVQTATFHHGTALQNRLWWWAAGLSRPAGMLWHPRDRYLLSRSDVDPAPR